jgi:hypothetical protein
MTMTALAGAMGVAAMVGSAAAETPAYGGGYVPPGSAQWVSGAANTLSVDPLEALVGIGTSTPKAALHIHNSYDAGLQSSNHNALRLTGDVKDGYEMLLFDANEILAGRYVSGGSALPHTIPSRLHLQHEGGEILINGGVSGLWTLLSGGSINTAGPLTVRSDVDVLPNAANGPVVIGPNTGNLGLDGNEIMARANGEPSTLHLNAEGGAVMLHGHGSMPAGAAVVFYDDGRVRIGRYNSSYGSEAKLTVDGLVVADEIRVTPDGWADHVFEPGYSMRSIAELEAYVRKHGHLPGIVTEASVMKDGLPVASFSKSLLQNVEELTLRVIAQQKQIDALEKSYGDRLAKLEAKLERLAK